MFAFLILNTYGLKVQTKYYEKSSCTWEYAFCKSSSKNNAVIFLIHGSGIKKYKIFFLYFTIVCVMQLKSNDFLHLTQENMNGEIISCDMKGLVALWLMSVTLKLVLKYTLLMNYPNKKLKNQFISLSKIFITLKFVVRSSKSCQEWRREWV